MRRVSPRPRRFPAVVLFFLAAAAAAAPAPARPAAPDPADVAVVGRFFEESLARGQAYDRLHTLVTRYPGRLSGSKNLAGAIAWAESTLRELGVDRLELQPVKVPHWERGAPESVALLGADGTRTPLAALALGGTVATPPGGVAGEVVEVRSLDELSALGPDRVRGRIVFFNRPMDPAVFLGGTAYARAVDQRSRGPALAAQLGAVGAVVRSMTHARDDLPHTGSTNFAAGTPRLPAAALSTLAADRLSAALAAAPADRPVRLSLELHSRWLPDADSHNVIGELRGREFPDRVILVGGHLDSWDVSPGAHDNGSGVVQSLEVLRLFKTLGIQPRHTLRCVLFTNEENGLRGSLAYAAAVKAGGPRHVLAVETDNGGFQPRGFNLGSTQGDAHERAAARWRTLFEPYGIVTFRKGTGGADVNALLVQGVTVAGLLPDSQRYFDVHHTAADDIGTVNARELHLGAAALAALVWLVDTHGL